VVAHGPTVHPEQDPQQSSPSQRDPWYLQLVNLDLTCNPAPIVRHLRAHLCLSALVSVRIFVLANPFSRRSKHMQKHTDRMLQLSGTRIVASAVALALASQCARNILQTGIQAGRIGPPPISQVPPFIFNTSAATIHNDSENSALPPAVVQLQQMKRRDLVRLFCQSQPPTNGEKALTGDWNGCLLDNNGKIMTLVSNTLTHSLFGAGYRQWNGKSFFSNLQGINRFRVTSDETSSRNIAKRHKFDFSLQPSRMQPGTESIQLIYKEHHRIISPWHTMMDEVRVVAGHPNVLIGMGCVAWGGGFLNAAPFCLWREKVNDESTYESGTDRSDS
jgi:hypothetical protein